MPNCWYLLVRFFLRVDRMFVRLRETRLFCDLRQVQILCHSLLIWGARLSQCVLIAQDECATPCMHFYAANTAGAGAEA